MLGIISLFIDLIYLKINLNFQQISLIYPMFFLVYLIVQFLLKEKISTHNYILIIIYSFTSGYLIFNCFLIFTMYVFSKFLKKSHDSLLLFEASFLFLFSLYNLLGFIILCVFQYLTFSLSFFISKFLNLILINVLYSIILYFLSIHKLKNKII